MAADGGEIVEVLFAYEAKGVNEMSIAQGEILKLLSRHGEWVYTEKQGGQRGMVPATYISEPKKEAETAAAGPPPPAAAAAAVSADIPPPAAQPPAKQPRSQSAVAGAKPKMRARAVKTVQAKGASHLSFAEGDIITIVEQFPTGWWRGELNGRFGLLPKGAVVPLGADDAAAAAATAPKTTTTAAAAPHVRKASGAAKTAATPTQQSKPAATTGAAAAATEGLNRMFSAKALYGYAANTDVELSFAEGDVVAVLKDDIPGGWWLCELRGKLGHVPSGFFKKVEEDVPPPPPPPAAAAAAAVAEAAETAAVPKETASKKKKKEEEKAPVAAETTAAEAPVLGQLDDPEGQLPKCPFKATALYDYTAASSNEMTLKEGEEFNVVAYAQLGWCTVDKAGKLGHVPRGWIKPHPKEEEEKPAAEKHAPAVPTVAATAAVPEESSTKQKVRALFAFEPQGEGQLALKEGDIVTAFGKPSAAGWWQGEVNGVIGFFPESFVTTDLGAAGVQPPAAVSKPADPTPESAPTTSPVTAPAPAAAATTSSSTPIAAPATAPVAAPATKRPANMPVVKAKVVHSHKARDKTQLTLAKGDIVTLLEMPVRELWTGELNGTVGKFPGSCVKMLTPEELKERDSKDKDKGHSVSMLSIFGLGKPKHQRSTSSTATAPPQSAKAASPPPPPHPAAETKPPEAPKSDIPPPPPPPAAETKPTEHKRVPSKTDVPPPTSAHPTTSGSGSKRPMPTPPVRGTKKPEPKPVEVSEEQRPADQPQPEQKPEPKKPEVETTTTAAAAATTTTADAIPPPPPPAAAADVAGPAQEVIEKLAALESRLQAAEEENKRLKEQIVEAENRHAAETEQLWKQVASLVEAAAEKEKAEEQKKHVSVEEFERVQKLASDLDKWMREEMTAQRNRETQVLKLQATVDALRAEKHDTAPSVPTSEPVDLSQ